MADLIGTMAGNYQLVERLGAGGMGEVLKGVHSTIGSKVAIKILNATCAHDRGIQQRFLLEAKAVNRIDHPGVFGQSIDRSQPIQFTAFPKSGGAPVTFEADLPQRCLTGLSLASNGHLYAGTWDTSKTAWVANVTSFAPATP